MTWAIRSGVLAAGAAALLSTQAVYAAPIASQATGVDPLISLSVLGTSQSRGAVCSGATFGAAACGVPVSAATASMAATAAAVQDQPPPPPKAFNPLLIILGVVVFAALMAAILSGGGDASGDLTPVSPQ